MYERPTICAGTLDHYSFCSRRLCMNVPQFALERRIITLSIATVLVIWGIAVYFSMSRREDPEIVMRVAQLVTVWPGAEVSKIEQLVTRPLEMAIKEVSEVDEIESNSRVGISSIIVRLLPSVEETDIVWTKIRAKIQRVQPDLPDGCLTPDFNTEFGDVVVMILALYQTPLPDQQTITHPYTMRQMNDFLKDVEDQIQEIPMVSKIDKYGLQKEIIYIEADAREWGQLALSAGDLTKILQSRNIIAPGGVISTANVDYNLQPSGEFLNTDQIGSVLIATKNGVPIRLSDLNFNISRRYEEPSSKYVRYCSPTYPSNERRCPCVILGFSMRSGFNVVKLGEEVERKIQAMQANQLPRDLRLEIVSNIPNRVSESVSEFIENLWEAMLIVVFVAFIIIGWRGAVIMATAIPISIVVAIGSMSLFHVDLEQCSIAALIIALGMLVDNAVVISDNVIRLMDLGVPKKEACWRGANELFIAVLNSTLTTVAAFLPMLTIPGDTGRYIRGLPIVVCSTLMISLVVAMTITPMMCYILLPDRRKPNPSGMGEQKPNPRGDGEQNQEEFPHEPIATGILGYYGRIMNWCLDHKTIVVLLAFVLLIGSIALLPIIGTAFFPRGLRNQFVIEADLPAGSSITNTDHVVYEIEKILLKHNCIQKNGNTIERFKNSVAYIGMSGPRFFLSITQQPPKTYYAQMMVNMTSKLYTDQFIHDIQPDLNQITGARVIIRPLSMGPPIVNPICIRVKGGDPEVLLSLAQRMEKYLEKIPGTEQVNNSWGTQSYQLAVAVDEDSANLAGVSNLGIANTLYGYFNGIPLTTYREDRHQISIVLRVKPEQRNNLDYLDYLYVEGRHGKVPLNAVAKVTPEWQVALIQRKELIRTIEVCSFVKEGYLSNKISQQAMEVFDKEVPLPPGYSREVGGESEKTSESQSDLMQALAIALVLIALPLIFQFNSLWKTAIIFITMPLALIGALPALLVSGWPLGFMPILGIVSLCGVVVNNAILLLDFIDTSIVHGVPLRTSLICCGQIRMRPIFITVLTTIGGFVPLALFGGPLWEGMAYVMIFGLLISTFLTLIIIPVVFKTLADWVGYKG